MPETVEIQATYRVTTPCFCGGVDGRPEVRAPSFKGVLRFWWRALAWSRCGGDLHGIKQREDRLFGSAAGGRSPMSLTITGAPQGGRRDASEVFGSDRRPGVHYLGFGLPKQGGQDSERQCLVAPFDITVTARCRLRGGDDSVTEIVNALTAVGLFGGLGAKSRKGLGSLALTGLSVDGEGRPVPHEPADLEHRIRELLPTSTPKDEYPAYTAFSARSRVLLLGNGGREPLDVIDRFGRGVQEHVKGQAPAREQWVRRAAFGLPRKLGSGEVKPQKHDRRASPMLLHVHEGPGRPVGVLSYLPAHFLPKGEGRKIEKPPETRGRRSQGSAFHDPTADPTAFYAPVEQCLEQLRDGELPSDGGRFGWVREVVR